MTGSGGRDRPILLTGGSGQVGYELNRQLGMFGAVVAPARNELDLAKPDGVRRYVRDLKPGLIVNAAAYTAVDQAESEAGSAKTLNEDVPGLLAEEAKQLGAALVHYSTDYVFDGTKDGPYNENDAPNPLSVYGSTKLNGERAVQASGAAAVIFRCEWIYSRRGRNFLLTMLRLGKERAALNIVSDQKGAPTWARAIAVATTEVISRANESDAGMTGYFEKRAGVYHMAASGFTTWFGFAEAIFERATEPHPVITPISTSQYPTPARRPMNSVLDTSKLAGTFGVTLADWRSQLDKAMSPGE
jgi:dTDP-4-dehydrorhamnose reductase